MFVPKYMAKYFSRGGVNTEHAYYKIHRRRMYFYYFFQNLFIELQSLLLPANKNGSPFHTRLKSTNT